MHKVGVILHKEWLDIKLQRNLLLSIILPPLIITLLPIVMLYVTGHVAGGGNINGVNASTAGILGLSGLSPQEFAQALLGKQFSVLYVLLPLIIPSIIAAYSVVGEKTSRTLEPLLATPVRTWELLLGKSLIAMLPAVLITWLCGGAFILAVLLLAVSSRVVTAIITPGWLIVFLLWTPLLALIAIAVMMAISSRVNDPRTAQQISAWAVVPFLTIFIGQISGLIILGPVFALTVFIILVPLTILAIWIATKVFQREVILTQWK